MATFLAHIRIRPGLEAQFEQIVHELHQATHRDELNVRRYEYWRGAEPSTYYALASFDDFAAFVAHQTSDHHERASPGLREVTESMRVEWVDPLPDASPLAATASGTTPPDASALEAECYGRFADAVVQGWWRERR